MGVASQFFDIPVPMPALRDQPAFSDAWLQQLEHMGDGRLQFQWSDAEGEETYEVYRGELAMPFTYGHHSTLACGLPAGSGSWTTPDDQVTGAPSYYYLVVPRRGTLRAWGTDGAAMPRPPAASPCP